MTSTNSQSNLAIQNINSSQNIQAGSISNNPNLVVNIN
jgi:hypothetical protein